MGCSFYHKDKKGKNAKTLTNKCLYVIIQAIFQLNSTKN